MTPQWITQVLERRDGDPTELLDRLCGAAVGSLGVSGIAVVLVSDGRAHGTLCATDDMAAHLEDLQFTLGEGPALDAHGSGSPVNGSDLTSDHRWPGFARAAAAAGVRAVHAWPLRVGAARLGVLVVHRCGESPTDDVHRDLAPLIAALTELVLDLLAGVPPGMTPVALNDVTTRRSVVHAATGMVAAQLDVSVQDALVALRARAYAEGRGLGDLAADVVDRRLRFSLMDVPGAPGPPDA